jgi:kinetochore protein Nuf2
MERSKERSVWQRKREVIQSQQKELEAEMAAFVSENEGEINELLGEYWTMRRQAGELADLMSSNKTDVGRGLHEHDDG